MEYDPFSYELDEDPYPVYRWMRDEAPAYYNERLDFWAITRFDDCHQALTDHETYSSARGTVLELMNQVEDSPLIIFMDPPRQTRIRNLVSKAFTPRRIAELEPRIREIAAGWLDPIREKDGGDLVEEFTAKLPMDVISTLLGIPESDRDDVRGWSNDILHREPESPEITPRGYAAMGNLMGYFQECLDERRKRPRDDIMTLLIEAEVPGEGTRLDDTELKAFFNLLATAGNETVTKLLATLFDLLAAHPEQRRHLVDTPGDLPLAVEETLRFDPPSQYQGRVTTREVTLHGRTLPEGARVLILNAASGRDERKYPDPDRWDVTRRFDLHLNFGYGRHICLGKNLALLESRLATQEFLARFPDYEVVGRERMHSSNVRGLRSLKITAG